MREFKPALAFNILTPFYDLISNLLGYGSRFHRKIIDSADIKNGERLLDVGCGSGKFLLEVKKKYPKVEITGIDPDKNILKIALQKFKKAKVASNLVEGYAQRLPFSNNSFDVVVSTLVFHHLPTSVKRKAIEEIKRVLVENGRFLLVDFGKQSNFLSNAFLNILSIFDGRENMRANLEGKLPIFLHKSGFSVEVIKPRYRGLELLLARKK